MERCPHCGQLSREGAKFCTSCGQRIADAVGDMPSPAPDVESSADVDWPTPPAAEEMSTLSAQPDTEEPAPAETPPGEIAEEPSFGGWPTAGAPWPTVTEPRDPTHASLAVEEPEIEKATEELEIGEPAAPVSGDARLRAVFLLDELREAIAAIGGEAPRDLSGVVSELEVAVTPPGAIGHEELNDLREALLRARERPRDLDTILDLTGRIDALVALTIAYDRTVAAIERALETLKGDV